LLGGLFREVAMTATIYQFIPKPNPKLIEDPAIEIQKQINHGWLTEEQIAKIKADEKNE